MNSVEQTAKEQGEESEIDVVQDRVVDYWPSNGLEDWLN